jgi:lysophospholipase
MDLIKAAGRAPPHSIVGPVVTSDGQMLRCARWPATASVASRQTAAGTVLICLGRSEFIEKYNEVVSDLQRRGFTVVMFDWQGQGLSSRRLRDLRKGHVAHFTDYEADLAAVVAQVLEPFCPKPWYALAHSMGGTIALGFAGRHPAIFRRLVLSAPMIEIARLPMPELMPWVARILRMAGLGRAYAPGGRGRTRFFESFENNILTSDAERYARTVALLRAEPGLGVDGPTVDWVHAAFEAMAELQGEPFVETFKTPTLFIVAGHDLVVESRATEALAARLRASRTLIIPHARHEILMERDVFREQFWAAFDAFVPGTS